MRKIGVGLIGVQPDRSWAAIAHIPALRSLERDFEIVALSTTRQESADAAAARYGVANAFASAEALCGCEGVDLVAVTVKVPHHFDLVCAALDAGKHVYCEWPLGNGLEEARQMSAMAQRKGLKAVCGLQARFSPALAYARHLIQQGYVGEVLSVSVIGSGLNWGAVMHEANAYSADVRNGATMLSIPVSHTLDGLCQAVGELVEVQAILANARRATLIVERGEQIPLTSPDQVLIQGRLESGAPISVHYRGGAPRGPGLLVEISGSAGDLQLTGAGGHAQLLDLELKGATAGETTLAPIAVPDSYSEGVAPGAQVGNIARVYRRLATAIREDGPPSPSFEDAVRRHQMIAAIEASAKSGCAARPADF